MFRQAPCVVFASTAIFFAGLLLLAIVGCKKQAAKVEKSDTRPSTIGRPDLPTAIAASIGMKLTLIPPGEFMMGSDEPADSAAAFYIKNYGEEFLTADFFQGEYPRHRVRITRPFYMGTFHVTRGQFRRFVADTGYKTDAEKGPDPRTWGWNAAKNKFESSKEFSWRHAGFEQTDEHPVVNVSWNDATAFCEWLSGKEGKTYRLPTEAEWEYACRAGTTTRYYSGDNPESLARIANVGDALLKATFPRGTYTIKAGDGYAFTAPVGSFRPNAFGLYDMHGNAWQWCADYFDDAYYGKSPPDDPRGPESGLLRVLRGGSWFDGPDLIRSAARFGRVPSDRFFQTGFRVARDP